MGAIRAIYGRDYVGWALTVCAVVLAPLMLMYQHAATAVVFASVLFTAFDLCGFKHVLNDGHGAMPTAYYRIMQGTFQVVLYFAIWQVAGARALAATALVWWTGGCDLLYYFLGRYPLWTKSWTWLWWTPGGLLSLAGASGNRDHMWFPLWAVIVQSAAGLGLAAWIIWR